MDSWLPVTSYPSSVGIETMGCQLSSTSNYLHSALSNKASSEDVGRILKLYPKSPVTVKDADGTLPLHIALRTDASLDIIQMIFEAYPEAVQETDFYGDLPLHIALKIGAHPNIVLMLCERYPEATKVQNKSEDSPLHISLDKRSSSDVINYLFEKYSEAVQIKNFNNGDLPLHLA